MDTAALLAELYGRVPPLAQAAVEGLDAGALANSPEPTSAAVGQVVLRCVVRV
jgi:hypothetical protein